MGDEIIRLFYWLWSFVLLGYYMTVRYRYVKQYSVHISLTVTLELSHNQGTIQISHLHNLKTASVAKPQKEAQLCVCATSCTKRWGCTGNAFKMRENVPRDRAGEAHSARSPHIFDIAWHLIASRGDFTAASMGGPLEDTLLSSPIADCQWG